MGVFPWFPASANSSDLFDQSTDNVFRLAQLTPDADELADYIQLRSLVLLLLPVLEQTPQAVQAIPRKETFLFV